MTIRGWVRIRPGFTLVETIVTLGLLAVLAAFVVPTVVQKAGAGDPVKVVTDLSSIQTGMSTFQTDIGGVAGQIRMLTVQPSATNHFVDSVTALKASEVQAWNGPYVNAEIGFLAVDSLATGFRAFIKNVIVRFDATNNASEFSVVAGSGTGGSFDVNNTVFATLTVVGLSSTQARVINRLIDGDDDAEVIAGPLTGANTQGRFRYDVPNANGIVVAYYLATPIAK